MLALSVNRRNQAPIDRELEASGACARQRVPNGHSVRDTCSQKTVAERADFSAARAT